MRSQQLRSLGVDPLARRAAGAERPAARGAPAYRRVHRGRRGAGIPKDIFFVDSDKFL